MNEQRRPGRPQIADPAKIGLAAMALFAERGYSEVSMDDVAAHSGVSRRTLFRHFDNKADLIWQEFFANYARVSEVLQRPDTPLGLEGVRVAIREVLGDPEMADDVARVRLRIIGQSPEVFAAGVRGLQHMTADLAHHLSRSDDFEEDSLEATAAGQAITGSILVASVWWAHNSDGPVVDAIETAFDRLERGIH